jgi:signal peptidase I
MWLATGTKRPDAHHDQEKIQSQQIHEHRSRLTAWASVISIAVVALLILKIFVVQNFLVISPSMESTLLVGDFVVVNRAVIGARFPVTNLRLPGYSSLRRQDVIVFRPPPTDLIGMDLVKRLIGLPGDTIEMRDRMVYVDAQRLDEPYASHVSEADVFDPAMAWQKQFLTHSVDPRTYAPTRDNWGPLIVPTNYYFVMGDNRAGSIDSRYWGFVDANQIEGRADFVYFSYHYESSRPTRWIDEIRWGRIGRAIH